jgi:hypothetical protein
VGEDVVDVEAGDVDGLDPGEVPDGQEQVGVRGQVDEEGRVEPERLEQGDGLLGLGLLDLELARDDEVAGGELVGQGRPEGAPLGLLRQLGGIVARLGSEDRAALPPER